MKIMHVTKKYPNALGGDSVVVSNLENQQKLNGHKVVILTSNCDEIKNDNHIYKVGFKDTSAGLDNITIKRLASLIILFFKTFKVLKIERPDVIHTHSIEMAFIISFAARHYNVPILHTFHILTFYDENQSLIKRKTELFLLRKVRPAIITTPNKDDERKLKNAGMTQVVTLPNGVNLNFWQRKQLPRKNNEFTFVSVGRLEEQKGFEYIIKAAKILRNDKNLSSFKIIFVGEGSLKNNLIELASLLGVAEHIQFVGRKTQKQIRNIYAKADAMIIASLFESGPITLLEAWAMKVPVISTPVGILRNSQILEAILSVKTKDEKSLANRMESVIKNKAVTDNAIKFGSAQVLNYSWDNISSKLVSLYKDMLLRHTVQISAYYPPHIGGVELRVQELSERLAKEGNKVNVITSNKGSTDKVLKKSNLTVEYLPSIEIAHTPFMLSLPWKLVRINKHKTIFHVYVAQVFVPETVAIIAKLRRIPYVADFEMDVERSGIMGFLLPIHKRWVLGPVLRNAHKVIVLTDDYVDIATNKYGVQNNKIRVIPSATSFKRMGHPRKKPNSPIRILFVGRFAEQKNPILLLEAVKILAERSFPFELTMVGDGEIRKKIERYILENNLQDKVKLLGFIVGRQLEEQYENADIFVLSSKEESFGIVLIEAMSKGLPVIATDIPAVRNTIVTGKNGILIPQDPIFLADAVQTLNSDNKLYEMLSSNNITCSKEYQWDSIVSKVESAYEE